MQLSPVAPSFEYMFRIHASVADPIELGRTPRGLRRIINITGGTVEGPVLSGIILPGGADWQVIREDGTAVLEARYTIKHGTTP